MTQGPEYVVASREGLYIVTKTHCRRVASGQYFGVTVKDGAIYAFENAGNRAGEATPRGRIVRFSLRDGAISDPEILVERLHYKCHQVDFFDGSFFVVDTENQRILEFDSDWRGTTHQILPPIEAGGTADAHINSLLGLGDRVYVLFHNGPRERPSELLEYDRDFVERHRTTLGSTGCHDIVRLEDGRFLYCESTKGQITRDDGLSVKIDQLYTRGLAVGEDEIAVGSSLYGKRLTRDFLPGFVTFLDRSYQRLARLYVPAAPTQIRRLDGADLSLSRPR